MEFDELFLSSKGNPVIFNDEKIMRIDRLKTPREFEVSVILISTSSPYKQAIQIKTDGKMVSQGSKMISDRFILWEEYLKNEYSFNYNCKSNNQELLVWNSWDWGDNVTQSWLRGAAMKKEVITENHFRYYCNDGEPDDDFDDIVFDVVINPN